MRGSNRGRLTKVVFTGFRDHARRDVPPIFGDRDLQTELTIQTSGAGLHEFTMEVAHWLDGTDHSAGLLTLFVRHTSCSLLVQENADPDVCRDLSGFMRRLVPDAEHPDMRYLTHTMEGPDDMPAHIKAALLPTSLSVPVWEGRMVLGAWQGIYLFEHRDGSFRRRVSVHLAADRGSGPRRRSG